MRTLDELAHGRGNNFNLVRMAAASAVIVSHAYPLSLGPEAIEPLASIMPFSLGSAAVEVFFAVSGFFIMKSFDRRGSLTDFVAARVLRLYPALIVVALFCTVIVGPLFTRLTLSEYFSQPATAAYTPRALSLAFLGFGLPGVFANNPYPGVNGPLWTLYYEVSCYFGLTIAGLLGLFAKWRFPALLAAYALTYAIIRYSGLLEGGVPKFVTLHSVLSLPFLLGMAAYRYRTRIPLNAVAAAALAALAAFAVAIDVLPEEATALAISYGALGLGGLKIPVLLTYNRFGDYSYGTYIYGWPVAQMIVAMWPGITPLLLMALSWIMTLPFAIASWKLIEKPALSYKSWRPKVNSRGSL